MTNEDGGWTGLFRLGIGTYLLGGALLFYGRGSIILLPLVFGVLLRVLTANPDTEIPAFTRWFDLIYDGGRMLVVVFVYLIILPLVVLVLLNQELLQAGIVTELVLQSILNPLAVTVAVGLLTSLALGRLGPTSGAGQFEDTILVGTNSYELSTVEPLVLFAVLFYIFPAAVLRLAEERTLWAAFDFGGLKSTVLDSTYPLRWLLFSLPTMGALWLLTVQVRLGPQVRTNLESLSILLSNELGEVVVFTTSVASFFLLVVAHATLGHLDTSSAMGRARRFLDRHETDIFTLAVGGVLVSLAFSLPLVLIAGYVSRAVGHAFDGEEGLPSFTPWLGLLAPGLRVVLTWLACIAVPWVFVVLGQDREAFARAFVRPARATPDTFSIVDQALANLVVGLSGLPIAPPVAYQLDRLGGDALRVLGIPVRETPPHLLADPFAVKPLFAVAALLSLLGAFVVFPALLAPRRVKEGPEDAGLWQLPLLRTLGLYRSAVVRRAWVRMVGYWVLGWSPLVLWYVWRRFELLRTTGFRELTYITFPSLNVSLAAPTGLSVLSIAFLLVASTIGFYALVRSYLVFGDALRRTVNGR